MCEEGHNQVGECIACAESLDLFRCPKYIPTSDTNWWNRHLKLSQDPGESGNRHTMPMLIRDAPRDALSAFFAVTAQTVGRGRVSNPPFVYEFGMSGDLETV